MAGSDRNGMASIPIQVHVNITDKTGRISVIRMVIPVQTKYSGKTLAMAFTILSSLKASFRHQFSAYEVTIKGDINR